MKNLSAAFATCILLAGAGLGLAEEVRHGAWKAVYDANGIASVSFENAVWLQKSSLIVFKPGYKDHWFGMQGAVVTTTSEADKTTVTWKKKDGDRFEAELELSLASESAAWRGRLKVGVEGPVEMGIFVPSARLESPGGVTHCYVGNREMEFYRERPFGTFAPVLPVRFETPACTAVFERSASSGSWLVQDKREGPEPAVRFVFCDKASGKEPLEVQASLALKLRRYPPAQAEGRKALLSQRTRTYLPLTVKNSGFEEAEIPAGWEFGATAAIESQGATEGKRCLRIRVQSPEERSVYVTQKAPVQAGSRYLLSGMVKAEGVKPADVIKMQTVGDVIILEWADKDGKWLAPGAYSNEASFGTHGWQKRQTKDILAPAGAHYGIIFLAMRGIGTAWFDDIQLVECRPSVALAAPLNGSKLNDNRPLFEWRPDPDSHSYVVEVSQDPAMPKDRLRLRETCLANCFRPEKPLPPGKWHWRVSRDDGFASAVWGFEQTAPENADTTGPVISIESGSLEKRDQPLVFAVSDASGVKTDSIELHVDDKPIEAAVRKAGAALHAFPKGGWEQGAHKVTILAKDGKGNAGEESRWIVVAPPPPQKIVWTRDRGVLFGDRHRLPLGIYQVTEKDMPRVKAAGFDFVHNYEWEGSQDDVKARAYLDAAQRNGLTAFVGFDRGGASRNGLCQMNLAHVSRRIAALRDHPALLAWYLFDEPDLSHQYVSPHNMVQLYEHVRRLDPYHPVIVTFAIGDSPSKYPRCYDVYWTMVYSTTDKLDDKMRRDLAVIGDTPLMAICHSYDQKQAAAFKAGEPVSDAAFAPDLRLMRANAFASLANGTSGMCWWWYGNNRKTFLSVGDVPHAWAWLTQVVKELRELEPLLTAEGKPLEVKATPPDAPLRLWGRRVGAKTTLIAVNLHDKPLEAEFSAPDLPAGGEALVKFEDRKLAIKDGKLKDAFGPIQAHVYEIEAR